MPPEPRPAALTRRRLLASAAALAATPLPALAAAPPAPLTLHLVDGWILTSRDLELLGIDAL